MLADVANGKVTLGEFVAQLTDEQLIALTCESPAQALQIRVEWATLKNLEFECYDGRRTGRDCV